MALVRPHPRPFQDKRPHSQDSRSPQRRRRIKRGFGRLALQRRSLTHQGCSPLGAPPAETLNTKPYHGCHAKLPGQPRLRRIIRRHQGLNTTPLRISDWLVPATTDASVEPHTHHRRLLHAFGLLAPEPHGGKMERIVQDGLSRTLIVDMRSMLSCQTPYSRSSTPDLWAWGNVA